MSVMQSVASVLAVVLIVGIEIVTEVQRARKRNERIGEHQRGSG